MNFGYLPQQKSLTTDHIEIKPLSDIVLYDQIETSWPEVDKGWIYPRIEYSKKQGKKYPLKPTSWFCLKPSHELKLKLDREDNEGLSRFIVLVFGFLNGLHLVPEDWGFLQKTAIKPGTLVGFIIPNRDEGLILELIVERYLNLNSRLQKLEYALVHWFLMAQSYSLTFDRFSSQYRVSDLVYRIALKTGLLKEECKHFDRIRASCEALDIKTPDWALANAEGIPPVTKIRNELIHEALFAGEPIGMKYPKAHISFEITRLNELLVLRTLGVTPPAANFPNGVTRSKCSVKYGTSSCGK
jgi:hypothetical protein